MCTMRVQRNEKVEQQLDRPFQEEKVTVRFDWVRKVGPKTSLLPTEVPQTARPAALPEG